MHLTSFERLLLSMELRRKHESEPNGGYDSDAEIIEQGYTSLYPDVFGSTAEPELDAAVQNEVFDFLNMFRALHPGFEAGDAWNPDGPRYYQKFRGFDGNGGTGHYGFANFVIKKSGRFEESDGEINSHSETLSAYRAMHRRWEAMGKPFKMSEEQIDAVLKDS